MQIHYIWIKEYNTIKESGVNLSSRFLIKIEYNDGMFMLHIDENPEYIINFFNEENIVDVCAIIGKNGAGKSSVLKYIKNRLPRGLNSIIHDDLIIYSIDNQYYILYPEPVGLTVKNNTGIEFNVQGYEKIRFSPGLSNTDFIYYNYLLDYNEDHINWHGLYDISTTSLLLKERKRILDEIQPIDFTRDLLTGNSDLDYLHMGEVYRSVIFISRAEMELPFQKPKSLHLRLDDREKDYFSVNTENYPDEADLLNNLKSITNRHDNLNEAFMSNLWYSIFINFLIVDRKYTANNPYYHKIDIQENDDRDSYIKRFFSTMHGVTFNYESNGEIHEVSISKLDELSTEIPKFIELTKSLITSGVIKITNETEGFFNLDTGHDTYFEEFQDLYVRIKGITQFIQFRWHSLSSGEQSYLSFMSRFYSLIHEETVRLNRNLVILIDEGDTGYHPEWQRKFLKNTVKFLCSLFQNNNIQLIFTSNTPFLTSDLPKPNILFVEKSEEGKPLFHDKDNSNANTFAANIHTLFSDSFYMDGMLIGEYAKGKVNKIIEYLNDDAVKQTNNSYKKIIDSIGEPLLRRKLQDLWFEKFGLYEKLELLKRQVAEMEEQIKNETDDKNPL